MYTEHEIGYDPKRETEGSYEEPKGRGVIEAGMANSGASAAHVYSPRRNGYIKGIRGELQGKGRLIGWVQWVLFEIVRG